MEHLTIFKTKLDALACDGVLSPQISLVGDKAIWGKGACGELIFVERNNKLLLVNKRIVHNSFDQSFSESFD